MTRNNCIRKEKKYALICIKVKCLQKITNDVHTVCSSRTNFYWEEHKTVFIIKDFQ